jgi:YesN/AraC family two-component response regulator
VFDYNEKYLSRMIKKRTGKKFKDLVFEKKMEEVTLMLANSSIPIHDIMLHCGFTNETYFYQQFRSVYGVNPNDYRKKAQSDSHGN